MKKSIALLLALVMVVCLCACGSSSSGKATPAPAASSWPNGDVTLLAGYAVGSLTDVSVRVVGDYIHEKYNYATMMEVIRRAGVVDVMNLSITGHQGKGTTPYVPLVSTVPYKDKTGRTQHELDGYLVLTKIGTGQMISSLTQISNGLGLNLYIELY